MLRFGVLCLGINGTWRAGGVNAGTGAVGTVSGRKEPVWFLERLARKKVLGKRAKKIGV